MALASRRLKFLVDVDSKDARTAFDMMSARLDKLDRQLKDPKRLNIDDKGAELKLARMRLSADRLRERLERPMDLSVHGAASAEIKLLTLEHAASKLDRKLAGAGGVRFALNSVIASLGEFAGAGSALFNPITVAAGALAAVMAGPLLAALLPITAGFAGLALVIKPVFGKISAFFSATSAATRRKAWRSMDPGEQGITRHLQAFAKQWDVLAKIMRPYVIKAVNSALKILRQLMPALGPLIAAAGKALDQFLGSMSRWLKSKSGQKFILWLSTEGPRDIRTFGRVMWAVVQGIGRTFAFLRNAGNSWWRHFGQAVTGVHHAWSDFSTFFTGNALRIGRFFTRTLPTAADVWKEHVRIVWDKIKVLFLKGVLAITTTMGHLPGPLGAPFRHASTDIRRSLGKIQGDVRHAARNIQRDWDRLHGKHVAITFGLNLPPGVSYPGGKASRRHKYGARGLFIAAGSGPRADDVPVMASRGELVVPAHMVAAGLVDHLRGRIPGFAAGGLVTDRFTPPPGTFIAATNRAFAAAEKAIIAKVSKAATFSGGYGGYGAGSGGAAAALARRMYPAWGSGPEWAAWNYVGMRESGWNPYALNPGSGAAGIAQRIQGWAPFYQRGNALQQIRWFHDYIADRYGDPIRAAAHEKAFNWYGSGLRGGLFATPTLIGVGERGPERVDITPAGQAHPVFELTGNLYLEDGGLLGVVRGEIREHDRQLKRRIRAGSRA